MKYKKYLIAIVALLGGVSCTQKATPSLNTNASIDYKDEQNDAWIAQKYAKKLGVRQDMIARNIHLYQYINSWENAPCVKESPKNEADNEEKPFDPNWFYEKTMLEVFNLKMKPAKAFEELVERKMYLFYGKNYLSEGDILYFSSNYVNAETDPQFTQKKYDIAASGIYLTNNYFLTCNNNEKKIKIMNLTDYWKGDTTKTTAIWDKHFLAAERSLQDK